MYIEIRKYRNKYQEGGNKKRDINNKEGEHKSKSLLMK